MTVMQHETTIAEAADRLSKELPGHRVEILQGRLTVTPPADGAHSETLTWLIEEFAAAGARKAGLKYLQTIGIALPTGPDDFAIPDFALVEEDYKSTRTAYNCHSPEAFRLIVEVTSSNWSDDIGVKVDSYAKAADPGVRHRRPPPRRSHPLQRPPQRRLPRAPDLQARRVHPLPESIGVAVELPVDLLLDGDEH